MYYASKKSMFLPEVPNDKTLQSFIVEGFFRNPLAEKILEPCTFTRTTAPRRILYPFFELAKQFFLNRMTFRFPAREEDSVPIVFRHNIEQTNRNGITSLDVRQACQCQMR